MSIVGFVLATVMGCTVSEDPKVLAAKAKLVETVKQEVSLHQACETDDDCTFFPDFVGFMVNKAGISYVSNCTAKLQVALFPQCFQPGRRLIAGFGMEAQNSDYPVSARCEKKICVATSEGKRRDWQKENYVAYRKYSIFTVDAFCEKTLRDIEKSK